MQKLTVLFPKVEAGMGHIMTNDAVAEIFNYKYGSKFNVINLDFYKTSNEKNLQKFGDFLCKSVYKYTRFPSIGHFATFSGEFWGTHISTYFTMNFAHPHATKEGIKYMKKLNPDVVFSTHWATNYYAQKLEKKPLTIMYCPDATLNKLFKNDCDYALVSTETGLRKAQKDIFYKSDKLSWVPFCIRNQALTIKETKEELRKKYSLPDQFTVLMTEGGYGNGKMDIIAKKLLEKDLPITIIAICGKNPAKFEKVNVLKSKGKTTFICKGFEPKILEYMKASDLFCGKSGNMIAEPTFFGIPSIVSGISTFIEHDICKYYSKYVGCAIRELNPNKVCKLIEEYSTHPEKLEKYRQAAIKHHKNIGAEQTADFIFEKICEKYGDKYELLRNN